MTTALGPPPPGWVKKILEDFYREVAIDEHRDAIAAWPRWKRIGHAIVAGWRCPACKALKKRRTGDIGRSTS